MTDAPKEIGTGGSPVDGLVARAKNILLKPNEEWPRIEAEPATTQQILVGYVLPLAAIGPVASFIGSQVFGYGALGFTYRPSLISSLSSAIITYVLTVVGIFLLSLIADFLAPKFDGQSSRPGAFKLVAYSWTAGLIAGVFGLIPSLVFLSILGLYSIYLLYTGATPLMKVPQDKAIAYTVVTIVCAVLIYIVVGALGRAVVGTFVPGPTYMSDTGGTVSLPGVGKINLDKAQQAANEMEAAANGKRPAVEPAKLQALLPAAIGTYRRTATEASSLGGMGSEASGTYTAGAVSFRLKITDMAAVGAIAGIGTAMGVSQSREDADGYEKTGAVDGRMQTEKWRKSGSGTFSVVIANRFMVEADGSAASIDELKGAVASVNEGALAGLVS
jgi:hypothetical protein